MRASSQSSPAYSGSGAVSAPARAQARRCAVSELRKLAVAQARSCASSQLRKLAAAPFSSSEFLHLPLTSDIWHSGSSFSMTMERRGRWVRWLGQIPARFAGSDSAVLAFSVPKRSTSWSTSPTDGPRAPRASFVSRSPEPATMRDRRDADRRYGRAGGMLHISMRPSTTSGTSTRPRFVSTPMSAGLGTFRTS